MRGTCVMGGRLCVEKVNKLKVMERISQSSLVPQRPMNRRRSQFYCDNKGQLWKLHIEDSSTQVDITINNIRRVMDLPSSHYLLKPTDVRRVGINALAMCMPHGQLDLYEVMKQKISWNKIVQGLRHLADGIHWLHGHGIAHRDIKPENVVLDHGVFKWIDFDYSSPLSERVYCGSRNYLVPVSVAHVWKCSNEVRSKAYGCLCVW